MFAPSYTNPTKKQCEQAFEKLFGTLGNPPKNITQHYKETHSSEENRLETARRYKANLEKERNRKNHG